MLKGFDRTTACLLILTFVMVWSFLINGEDIFLQHTLTESCNTTGKVNNGPHFFGGLDYKLPFPVYYINMDSSDDRRRRTELLFGNLWDLRRSPAVAGTHPEVLLRLLGPENYQQVVSHIQRERNGDEAVAWNEVGCILSHLTTIQNAYLESHEMVMIMEDDVSPALM